MSQEGRTPESVEEDYPKIIEDLKFHIAKEKISEANNFKVEKEDIETIATAAARQQFAQYGMNNVPDDILQNYVKEMMSKEDHVRGMYDRAIEHKFVEWLKKTVKVTDKEVTSEEFSKLLQEEK
jgi:trigger factor